MVTPSGALLSLCPIVSPVSVFVEGAEPVDPAPQQKPAHPHPGALAVRVAEPGRRLEGHYLSASCHAILCRYKREMLSEVSNRDIDVIHQYTLNWDTFNMYLRP